MKFKSRECVLVPIVTFREIVYAAHPCPRVGKLIGRALTILWTLVVQWLVPKEMTSTTDMLSLLRFTRQRVDNARTPRADQQWVWAMRFLSLIPKGAPCGEWLCRTLSLSLISLLSLLSSLLLIILLYLIVLWTFVVRCSSSSSSSFVIPKKSSQSCTLLLARARARQMASGGFAISISGTRNRSEITESCVLKTCMHCTIDYPVICTNNPAC